MEAKKHSLNPFQNCSEKLLRVPRKRKCILHERLDYAEWWRFLIGRKARWQSSVFQLVGVGVAVLGAATLVYIVWEVGLRGRTGLSESRFPWFPPTAWSLAKKSPAPLGHGSSGAFCGKCLLFPARGWQIGAAPTVLRRPETLEGVGFPGHRLSSSRLRCSGPFSGRELHQKFY